MRNIFLSLISYNKKKISINDFVSTRGNPVGTEKSSRSKGEVIHTNLDSLRITGLNGLYYIKFSLYLSENTSCRFRLTSSDPSEEYYDTILHSCGKKIEYRLRFFSDDSEREYSLDLRFLSDCIFGISDIEFFKSYIPLREKSFTHNEIYRYTTNFTLNDYGYLMAPEPHSQERFLHLHQLIDLGNIRTLDIGAGGAPMFSDYILNFSKYGKVDLLIYNENDFRRVKRMFWNKHSGRYNLIQGDITDEKTLPSNKYDQILFIDVLEHIEKEYDALNGIKRMMHEHTKLIINVPTHKYKEIMGGDFHDFVGHVRDGYSSNQLKSILEHSGLTIEEICVYGDRNNAFFYDYYNENKIYSNDSQYEINNFSRVLNSFTKETSFNVRDGISCYAICKLK